MQNCRLRYSVANLISRSSSARAGQQMLRSYQRQADTYRRHQHQHQATPHSGTKWLLGSNGLNLMPTLLHTFTFFANINCICPVSNYFLLYLHVMWDFQYVFNCLFVFNNVFAQPFSFTMVTELEDTHNTYKVQRDNRLTLQGTGSGAFHQGTS